MSHPNIGLTIVEDALRPLICDQVILGVATATGIDDGTVRYYLSLATHGWVDTDPTTGAVASRLFDELEAAGHVDSLTRTLDVVAPGVDRG